MINDSLTIYVRFAQIVNKSKISRPQSIRVILQVIRNGNQPVARCVVAPTQYVIQSGWRLVSRIPNSY